MDIIAAILARFGFHALQQRNIKSVMNPILWHSAIAGPLCFIAAFGFRNHPEACVALVLAGIFAILFPCLAYLYFAITNPDRLQSESHVEQKQLFNMIQTKKNIVFSPVQLADLVNPYPETQAIALKQEQQFITSHDVATQLNLSPLEQEGKSTEDGSHA